MAWKWGIVQEMPSTNARIFTSLILLLLTGIAVIGTGVVRGCEIVGDICVSKGWVPPWEWLTTLGVFAGLDVAQFVFKRKTEQPPAVDLPPGTMVKASTTVTVPPADAPKPIDEVRPP